MSVVPQEIESHSHAITAPVTPMQMLQIAVAQGADLDRLQQLMDLQDRWEANQARKAFVAAMAAFKSGPIKILKSKEVNIPGGAKFSHATLADVVDAACEAMGKHGLSHKWNTVQEGASITVTCVLTHELGHSESVSLTAPPDDSGRKNTIQQIASTVTYLSRYTLMAAAGLAAKDMDDDGRAASKPVEKITEKQEADLLAMITELDVNQSAFLQYMGIVSLADLPAAKFKDGIAALNKKRKQQ